MKTLVIGLDGATFSIIDPLLEQGKLPALRELIRSGVRGELKSTLPPMSPAAWASFITGKNPGKHGLYDFVKRAPNAYTPIPVTSRDRRAEAIWSIMGRNGLKVGIVNVPLTYPPEHVNGFMISGFPTPPDASDYIYPRVLQTELRKEFPDFSLQKTTLLSGDEAADNVYDDTVAVTLRQTELLTYLMGQKEWDFLMTVYDSSDVVGHHFWRYTDPRHPEYDPRQARLHGDKISKTYEILDECVEKLLKLTDKDTLVIVCSDHGFGPVYYCVCFNSWLIRTGFMQLRHDFATGVRHALYRRGLNNYNLYRVASHLGLLGKADFLYKERSKLASVLSKFTLSLSDVDWTATRAYSFGNFGPIFINLKGREPHGIVGQGEDYQKVLSRIGEEAKRLRDPLTGKKVFQQIIRGQDIYSGPRADQGPDLLIFDTEMVYRAQRVFEFGTERLVTPHPVYSGSHDLYGIFIAQGEFITTGLDGEQFDITDVAPTLLHLLGLPIPGDADGRVLHEILTPKARLQPQAPISEKTRIVEEIDNLQL